MLIMKNAQGSFLLYLVRIIDSMQTCGKLENVIYTVPIPQGLVFNELSQLEKNWRSRCY